MPTVEIIAVNAGAVPELPEYRRFAWRGSSELVSDRSLFQPVLDRMTGAIVHLGDRSDHPEDPSWFCGHIIKNRPADEDWHEFQFDDDARSEVANLLQRMQEASPDRYAIFLTDFQFGPDDALEAEFESLAEFWERHDSRKLRHNTLYHIGRRKSSPNQRVEQNRRAGFQSSTFTGSSNTSRACVSTLPAAVAHPYRYPEWPGSPTEGRL